MTWKPPKSIRNAAVMLEFFPEKVDFLFVFCFRPLFLKEKGEIAHCINALAGRAVRHICLFVVPPWEGNEASLPVV